LRIHAKLEIPNIDEMIKDCGLNERGKAQRYIDKFILDETEPYVPGRHINEAGAISTDIGSGQVIWDSPDAQYLYEEKLMVDPITLKGAFFSPDYGFWSRPNTEKILSPSGRKLEYHGGGKRGGKWVDRMLEDNMDELIDGVQKIVNGGKSWIMKYQKVKQ